jgi:hypothetical protein
LQAALVLDFLQGLEKQEENWGKVERVLKLIRDGIDERLREKRW